MPAVVNPFPTARQYGRLLSVIAQSEIGPWFFTLLGVLVALLLTQNQLNVRNAQIAGQISGVLADYYGGERPIGGADRAGKPPPRPLPPDADAKITRFAQLIASQFAVFALLTVAAVSYRYTEERLGLLWRQWMTARLMALYLSDRAYLRLMARPDIDNPDQRITEDVKTFVTTSLSLVLILLRATIDLIAFSYVLWVITPNLVVAAVIYAAAGTVITGLVGGRLIDLNVKQFQKEADLRYELIRFRESGEQIALQQEEARQAPRLIRRLDEVVGNNKLIINVNRNLGFFTTPYGYLTAVVPMLVVAVSYFQGKAKFEQIAEGTVAFGFVLNAISLFVNEFPRLTTLAAASTRLEGLWVALREPPGPPPVTVVEESDRLVYDGVTLVTPKDERLLIADLSLELPKGKRLLIVGPAGVGKSELLRATAGMWRKGGRGRIIRPPLDQILFLPSRPYQLPGSLREILVDGATGITADELMAVIEQVHLTPLVERVGGLDEERDWAELLSVGELQLVSFARLLVVRPPFAVLDEATSSLDADRQSRLYEQLARTGVTYISLEVDATLRPYHDEVLLLQGEGKWKFGPAREYSETWIG